jgi:hypothetical protein
MNNQPIVHGNIRQQISLYSSRRHQFIFTPLKTSDSFPKSLQREILLLKISILHTKHTMKKLQENDCLSPKGKNPSPKEGKTSQRFTLNHV